MFIVPFLTALPFIALVAMTAALPFYVAAAVDWANPIKPRKHHHHEPIAPLPPREGESLS